MQVQFLRIHLENLEKRISVAEELELQHDEDNADEYMCVEVMMMMLPQNRQRLCLRALLP